MSWLSRSLANSLALDHRSDGGEGSGGSSVAESRDDGRSFRSDKGSGVDEKEEDDDAGRGVKEDISELSQTLARQLWGVASFLAPLPQSAVDEAPPDPAVLSEAEQPTEEPDSAAVAGIRNDFAEIGGRFRSGISKISGNMGVSEISKFASNFLPFRDEEEEERAEEEEEDDRNFGSGAIGITDEVMSFVHNISMHAETWLDFPLLSDDEDSDVPQVIRNALSFSSNQEMQYHLPYIALVARLCFCAHKRAEAFWLNMCHICEEFQISLVPNNLCLCHLSDFHMSDAQLEHAYTIECFSPRLAALRIELCPNIMSEGSFWKTYFVLLHPRLNKQDAELLSTPQVVEARTMLLQKLQNQSKSDSPKLVDVSHGKSETSFPFSKPAITSKDAFDTFPSENPQTESLHDDRHPNPIIASWTATNQTVAEEERQNRKFNVASNISVEETDDDDWPEDEDGDTTPRIISIPIDEDVSFSDLEEDDEKYAPKALKT
ncbi:hypothetical protein ZIOFF_009173 [Zingiber officinale]|uniref:BSD domain-containing protein n=1 Tax=Zingiber officinale TaxID=94328 RepID=A0A8J5I3C1_ZINOF|nr:hypothetical protein ZIOFF_009173 [Zingiber officinale]